MRVPVVEGAVPWGLAHRRWYPVWVGGDRTTAIMEFFSWLGRRRARSIHTVSADMWAGYIDAVRTHLPDATVVFDRFHLSQHLRQAVDDVRRQTWGQMEGAAKADFNARRRGPLGVLRSAPGCPGALRA